MRPLFCCVALAAMLSLIPGLVPAQTGAPSAAPPRWLNPFCAVRANVVPWDAATNSPAQTAETVSYRLQLRSEKPGSTLDAHVTLVADSGLYDARVHRAPLSGTAFDQQTPALLVTFSKPITVTYAFVYEYYTDYTPQVACPSDVTAVRLVSDDTRLDPPAAGPSIAASFMRALPSLPCGTVYTAPRVTRAYQPPGSLNIQPDPVATVIYSHDASEHHSDLDLRTERNAEVLVFLNSAGVPVDTYLERSTNVDSTDKAALTAAQLTAFAPATFLCTPTVSQYLFRVNLGSSK